MAITKIKIKILKKGDSVLNISDNWIAVKRKGGDVDILPLVYNNGLPSIDFENIISVTYGDCSVETVINSDDDDILITTF